MLGIIITDKPKWCRLMESGNKTIEARRNKALANAIKKIIAKYGKCLIVVCESGTHGKVPFQFWCDKVEEILWCGGLYKIKTLCAYEFEKRSCLNDKELANYFQGKNGYAIHISKLEVFDKPKELSEFRYYNSKYTKYAYETYIHKAPQNFAFIEIGE